MNADLERLIALQRLDSAAHDAEQRLADEPLREKELDARLEAARLAVTTAKEQLAENQNARRTIEKEVAVHQARLSKFREQTMAVKTNQELHAIQHQIAFAETEVKALEDKILEGMMEADDLNGAIKKAESALTVEQKTVEQDKRAIAAERVEMQAVVERVRGERSSLVAAMTPQVLATFERVAQRRNGVAMAQARDGVCTICHVRLRPQVFNTVLKNEQILQCDHCNRILYHVPVPAKSADTPQASSSS
jgi:predicted  nucleic acid-binding Zn-ribbon protein